MDLKQHVPRNKLRLASISKAKPLNIIYSIDQSIHQGILRKNSTFAWCKSFTTYISHKIQTIFINFFNIILLSRFNDAHLNVQCQCYQWLCGSRIVALAAVTAHEDNNTDFPTPIHPCPPHKLSVCDVSVVS